MVGERKALERQDVAAALADGPFAAALARGAPLIIVAGSPATVLFATPAALELLAADSCETLETALISAQSPGARRLRRLAETLPIGGAPRRELLRFYSSGAPLSLTLVSARLLGPEGEPWAAISTPLVADEPQATPRQPAPSPPPPAEKFEPPPLDGPVRFLWMLDAEGRFGAIDSALVERLGPNAPRPGETLAELSARARLGSDWMEAVAAQRTFSALHLAWPEPGPRARIVRISGSPAFDRHRAFAGFRGFGVFTGEAVEAPPPPPAPRSRESAAARPA